MSDLLSPSQASDKASSSIAARHDRTALIAFTSDAQSEIALREGLAEVLPEAADVRRAGIRAAVVAMARIPTPRILVVDVSGTEEPLDELAKLSEVVEPDVCVLVIGEVRDADFYRDITKGLGAAEYLSKPLTRDMVSRHFAPLVAGHRPVTAGLGGGQLVTVTGARGGVGASTIATNLAWHLGVTARRHVVLLDSDLHTGTASFFLNVEPGPGLRGALETPDRVDELFIERSALPVSGRLHVLASDEKLEEKIRYAPTASTRLLEALRRRYTFVVADVPFRPIDLHRDLLHTADHRVLIMEPTLASVRDIRRLLLLPGASEQTRHAVVVLNRLGVAGGLSRKKVEEALERRVDIAIPHLPRLLSQAANMGEPAVASSGAFQGAILELAQRLPFARPPSDTAHGGEPRRWWQFFRRSQ